MIAKIKTRVDFGGIVNYANDQKNKKKCATLLAHEGVCAISNKLIADSFCLQASMRTKVKSPVKHVSLAFSSQDISRFPDNEEGDKLMVEIAKKWMKQMGIRNTQYIIARHHDTKHPHCHLVFNRIDNDGNLISDSNERIRNAKVCRALTKEYKQTLALDHINLQIKKGKIYGFIGQNGAGKTTFLRLVTGLAFPTSGTLSLWGNSGTEELQKQRKRIGSMIETPALFPSMTAYQNMEVQRIQRGIPDKSVIKRTLDMVGLQDTGKKSVRNFSLGMRQRLGIAIALLNTPELLILDEPINGLDPAGIVEIRNLLKILNKEYGMTILVSSHILEELYQTASEFILIDHGKIIEEISDYELNERCKRHIAIKTTDVQKTVLVLEENLHTDNFKLMPDGIIRLYDYLNDLETVASALAESHILVTGLSVSGDTLEDYFLSKIGGTKDVKSPKN